MPTPDDTEKYRTWVNDNFSNPIKEQLFDIYKESMHEDQNDAGRISKTIAKAAVLFSRLSADQERIANRLIWLTWALLILTAALVIFTIIVCKDTRTLVHREQLKEQGEHKKVGAPTPP